MSYRQHSLNGHITQSNITVSQIVTITTNTSRELSQYERFGYSCLKAHVQGYVGIC